MRKSKQPKDKTTMSFLIGARRYTLRIAAERLMHWKDRKDEINARIGVDTNLIWISPLVAPENRLEVLLHELWHAWRWITPRGRTIEEECDLFAAVAASIFWQLHRQGGPAALKSLKMTPSPAMYDHITEPQWGVMLARSSPDPLVQAAKLIAAKSVDISKGGA